MQRRLLASASSAQSFEAVNVTPLIDVVMCLIIFFLIVGKLATDRGIPVRLPQTGVGQEENAAAVMIVTVARAADGLPGAGWAALGVVVQIDGQNVVDAKALENAVRAKMAVQPALSIQVRADRELSFGSVEPVLRAAGLGGARSVRLATERTP